MHTEILPPSRAFLSPRREFRLLRTEATRARLNGSLHFGRCRIERKQYICKSIDSARPAPDTLNETLPVQPLWEKVLPPPTQIDFTRQSVIAVIGCETNCPTKYIPVSLMSHADTLCLKYNVEKADPTTYTMVPLLLLVLDKAYASPNIKLEKQ